MHCVWSGFGHGLFSAGVQVRDADVVERRPDELASRAGAIRDIRPGRQEGVAQRWSGRGARGGVEWVTCHTM